MVKRPRIAPTPPKTPPAADAWVNDAGLDPELQTQSSEPQTAPVETEEPPEKKGKPFPHRISFDMGEQQYRRLKRASFDTDRSMNELLREAVEDWLKTSDY